MRMLKRAMSIVFAMLIGVGCGISGPDDEAATGFSAGGWVEAWVEIWNTYELNRVDELFLQDDRLTYFSSEKEGVLIGIEAVREHHRGFGFIAGGKEQPNKLWLEDMRTTDLDNTVVVTGIWFFQRPDGSTQRGPVTIVYLRQADEYHIAHMNFSNYLDKEKEEEETS